MEKIDERMDMIGSAVLTQAMQESKVLISTANQTRDKEIADFKEQIVSKMFDLVQRETSRIRLESMRTSATREVVAHRNILHRRSQLTDAVFAQVRQRLLDYASSTEYRLKVLGEISQAAGRWNHSTSTVFLRESDLSMQEEIKALLPGCSVEPDTQINIGGWKLLNTEAGILVDQTLDFKLEEQYPWFFQHCGLKID